jgi:hypothetical protein
LNQLLILYKKKPAQLKDNNYKNLRKKWIDYFSKNHEKWFLMKKELERCFDFSKHADFLIAFQYFVKNILNINRNPSIRPGIYQYDILTKLFLDRFDIVFIIIFNKKLTTIRSALDHLFFLIQK